MCLDKAGKFFPKYRLTRDDPTRDYGQDMFEREILQPFKRIRGQIYFFFFSFPRTV